MLNSTQLLCGTAFKHKGVQLMLDAVIDYLPAPTDVASIKGTDLLMVKKKSYVIHLMKNHSQH